MSSNKEKYIEEVVQEVLNLQYMNDISTFNEKNSSKFV